MRILFLTHHYLSSNGGGSFASRAYINAFAELADEMTLLYPVAKDENVFPEINEKIKLVPVEYKVPKILKLVDLLIGRIHRYFKATEEIIKKESYDIVVFDTSLVSYRLIDKFKATGAKTIVIHHNYQYEYFRDNSKGLLAIPTLYWCKQYEGQAVSKADLNLTLTRQDTELLAQNYNSGNSKNFGLLGTFEYTKKQKRLITNQEDNLHRFVITGNLAAVQTEQSLIPWLKDYFPILKEIFPESTLTIAGKNPGEDIRRLCQEREIALIASPESMDPIMENADYYICPTCLGGGIKLRVMDGLKWGLPVISHSVSARGYDLFIEKECMFTYTDKESFRNSLITLKQKTFNKQQVYDDYLGIFSFEAGVERVHSLIDKIIKQNK